MFQLPNQPTHSRIQVEDLQNREYTRNPLFMFTTFWGVTCYIIKTTLELILYAMHKTILIHEYYVMIRDAYVDHEY